MSFVLKRFDIGPMQNFGYLIGDSTSREAMIVDPAWDKEKIFAQLKEGGFTLKGLLVSHAHFDHTNAIETILDDVDVPVYVNKRELAYADSGVPIVGSLGRTAKAVEGGETVRLGETTVEFLHTPGHTPGSQCLRVGNYLITGDTLFIGGCGRSDLPGGEPEALFRSLQKIARLPAELQLCPGHDYGEVPQRSLSDEMKRNPYLNMRDVSDFLQAVG